MAAKKTKGRADAWIGRARTRRQKKIHKEIPQVKHIKPNLVLLWFVDFQFGSEEIFKE